MAINYVDYEVLEQGKATYSNAAGELTDLLGKLDNMNGQLAEGWKNDTARAFVERFNSDHKIAIQKVVAALEDISQYINTYSSNRKDEDTQGASAISG